MREPSKYSYPFNGNFPPAFRDHLTALRGYENRLIPSQESLYGQEAYFEFHPCNPSCQIDRDTQTHMGHDLIYPSHSDLLESMTLFQDTVESLNDRTFLIDTREGFTVTDGPHYVLNLIIFFEIEDQSVLGFPAYGTKQTLPGFLFLNEAEGLSDEIHENLGEDFLTESLFKVMKGVVVGGFSVGETTEVGESSIVSEFSGEVSFGGGVAQVDQKEGFGEANRVIAFFLLIGGFILGEVVDEGEVDVLVEDFQ